MREQDGEGEAVVTTTSALGAAPQVDLAGLLAAHEQRRLANYEEECSSASGISSSLGSSTSSGSRCSSDEECEGLLGPAGGAGAAPGLDADVPLLRVNPAFSHEKASCFTNVYNRHYLFSLPALFLAVVRGHASLVYLLLKYGASVDFQVSRTLCLYPF